MADVQAAWGIDIGQAGLKAIRLKYAEAAGQVMAVAFDYVPHPKILSQPDANPEELITQALQTFLSRNQVKGDAIAISVPGQSALSRFIPLPPVDAGKIAEIVKYEAKQQIPFALEDVIWDYQVLGSGEAAGDFIVDAEVGLFAMKKEQVHQVLNHFVRQKVEVDLIQVAPLALYSFLCHDQLGQVPGSTEGVEEEEYTIVLDMGADNTSLLVTNGRKIWIRNIQTGGNQFTRALTKEMKLTFAKAEHLKCNATKAPDPKAIFQALRPVFNDYVAEIQRSIGYFSSVNRNAKIKRIVGVGNGFKLAGLQKFIQQNLQMDVERVESYSGLVGDAVLNAPLFQENMLSFAVPYGLALQGLKVTRLKTSLLPPEITTARIIRRKKPWMMATAATLLFGLTTSVMGYSYVLGTVSKSRFGEAEDQAKSYVDTKGKLKGEYDGAAGKNKELRDEALKLTEPSQGREHWLELYKAINESLPRDVGDAVEESDITRKNRIRLYSITAERLNDLGTWFSTLDDRTKTNMLKADVDKPPTGAGYVFTLYGRHFHTDQQDLNRQGVLYVLNTLLANLKSWRVSQGIPVPPEYLAKAKTDLELYKQQLEAYQQQYEELQRTNPQMLATLTQPVPPLAPPGVPVRQLGITHVILPQSWAKDVLYSPKGKRGMPVAGQMPADAGFNPAAGGQPKRPTSKKSKTATPDAADPNTAMPGDEVLQKIKQTDFIIQFVWKEVPEKDRQIADPDVQVAAPVDPAQAPGVPATPPGGPVAPGMPAGPAPTPMPTGGAPLAEPNAVPGVAPAGPPTGPAVPPARPAAPPASPAVPPGTPPAAQPGGT